MNEHDDDESEDLWLTPWGLPRYVDENGADTDEDNGYGKPPELNNGGYIFIPSGAIPSMTITSASIADGAITAAKIAASSITASKITHASGPFRGGF